jgi:hypothetical protein
MVQFAKKKGIPGAGAGGSAARALRFLLWAGLIVVIIGSLFSTNQRTTAVGDALRSLSGSTAETTTNTTASKVNNENQDLLGNRGGGTDTATTCIHPLRP